MTQTATYPVGAPAHGSGLRIKVTSLVKKFARANGAGEIIPVNDVSIDLADDEILVLLGPSGCGKTTLLRCIAGLERPDSGEIHINDELVFSSARNIMVPPARRPISMVFQSYALWPHMTVFENVAYPLQNRNVPAKEVRNRVMETLSLVGLESLANQYSAQISGGQQQRVALARAIVPKIGLVLFDEPLSNVDAKVREQLRAEITRMQKRLRFAAVYVTHDQIEAMAVGDRIAVLNNGRIEQLGLPEDIYNRPASRYVGTFIGAGNFWPGEVVGSTGGEVSLRTPVGDLVAAGAGAPLKAGQRATILVRPEAVTVGGEHPGNRHNVVTGTIETRVFLGSYTEYSVRVGDEGVKAWSNGANPLRAGATAFLSIAPSDLVLLRED